MKMKLFLGIGTLLAFAACQSTSSSTIEAVDFEKKLIENNHEQLVDVRSEAEFSGGHLPYAININVNGDGFLQQASVLDKDKAVFVYCQAGVRSHKAMEALKAEGFKKVYDLNGGIEAWNSAKKEIVKEEKPAEKVEVKHLSFEEAIAGEKLTLVDFYTEWCRPCKLMAPSIAMLKEERAADVNVVKVEAEQRADLAAPYDIKAYPTIVLFKAGKVMFRQEGMLNYDQLNQLVNIYK
jgi:thioredoxin